LSQASAAKSVSLERFRQRCAKAAQLLPFRDQVLAFAHDGSQAGIAFGPRRGHFRWRRRRTALAGHQPGEPLSMGQADDARDDQRN
jgi:hypothetical protein